MPAEIFPTRYRSTAYGISVAFGKLAYVLSHVISQWIEDAEHHRTRYLCVSIVWAAFMIIGAVSTHFLPETKERRLEEIADDELSADSNSL